MKTIIQVVQHLRPGGIEIIALDLLDCVQADEKTIIVSLEGDLESAIKHWPKLQAYREHLLFLDKQPGLTPSLVRTLANIFKKTGADAVHTHHIGPLLYAGLATRLSGIKQLTHTEHDAWHLDDNKRCLIQGIAVNLLKPTLVADAQTVADNMQQKLKYKRNITVIRNGINTQHFIPGDQLAARRQLMLPDNAHIIGCSGRMEKVKGQRVLIEALALLPKHMHVVFAGSGSTEPALRKLSDTLALSERIHFLGHIDQMRCFYQALDLFCLPSLNEGFPLSPLEAQSCNIKTLVTDVGASKETLCPHSGRFVIANDAQAMAAALQSMFSATIKVQPREFVKLHGDVQSMAKSYADIRKTVAISGVCYE